MSQVWLDGMTTAPRRSKRQPMGKQPGAQTMNDIQVSRTPRTTTEISITQHHNEPLIAYINGTDAVRLWRQSITTSGIVVTISELKALIEEMEKP